MGPKEAEKRRKEGLGNMADLARVLGVSVNAVKKAIDNGRVSRRSDSWIDLTTAAAEFRASSAGPTNGNGGAIPAQHNDTTGEQLDDGEIGGESMASARTRKERALADKAEIEAAKARAEVVDLGDAGRAWYSAARVLRERLLALPDHAGPALGLTSEQVTGLRGELVRVLTDLSDTMPEAAR